MNTKIKFGLLIAALAFALVLFNTSVPIAKADLPPSFEGADGNLVVNTPGNTDWANINPSVGIDQPSGTSDNSFGQGTKEDNPAVTVVSGSIPPNKSDLTRFYVSSQYVNGRNFLFLAWERSNVLGSANMDFEINQHATTGLTGTFTGAITLNRTAGDLLVTYDFTNGGSTPTLGLLHWLTAAAGNTASQCYSSSSLPCWGNHISLTSTESEGAINTVTVTDPLANPAISLPADTFGEAAVDLTDENVFPASTCVAFGSVFLKSRSSASFTAEVKDFVAPVPVDISNCGQVIIRKHTDPRGINQSFGYTSNIPGNTSFTLNDNGNTTSDSAGNTQNMLNVPVGSYTVTEGAEPANFVLESLSCTASTGSSGAQDGAIPAQADISVAANGQVICTYTNQQQLGAIKITKTSSKGTHPTLQGASFSITGPNSYSNSVTTGSDGTACVDHLPFGSYSVTETAAPTGYSIDNTAAQTASVSANSACGDGNEVAISATDTPLSQIQVIFSSLAGSNVTKSSIVCQQGTTTVPAVSENGSADPAFDDTNETFTNLAPGTYTCTVVVDP